MTPDKLVYLPLPPDDVTGERITRYERCDILTPARDPELPAALFAPGGMASDFTGVGLAWFEGGAGALGDLVVPDHGLATREEVVFDHGGARLRIFSFLHRQKGISLAEFADQWRAFAELFAAHDELTRHCSDYVQNHVYAPNGDAPYDGVAELGFRGVADVVAFMSEPSIVEELFPAEEPFIDRTDGVVVLTRPAAA